MKGQAPTEVLEATFEDRVAGALWGLHIADAMSMPTHWYYGGAMQVRNDYGTITDYVKPPMLLHGSIMALSNTGGAGRGGFDGDIIGTVIAHGKKGYWSRSPSHHYHCTLDKGENTLDADLVRVCYKTIAENKGEFDPEALRRNYVKFMTTPGGYNDCYVSTAHRMFFKNRERGMPLDQCPDNDAHNVDATCGLTMTVPVALATTKLPKHEAFQLVADCVHVTRRSSACSQYGGIVAEMLRGLIGGKSLATVIEEVAGENFGAKVARQSDPVVACYLDSNFPSMLHFAFKYGGDFQAAILANANVGGENVARGMILGSVLGAAHGASRIPPHMISGLKDSERIRKDIESFLAVLQRPE